jgi:elongation factor G
MNDPFVGSLTFCRIYSGTLVKGTYLNSVKDKKEKIGRMLLMHANSREDIEEAYAGDIVALAGLKETTTGDTLCAEKQPIILERMEFPEPVIEMSVEPKTKADQEKMGIALNRLAAEDPVLPRLDRSRIGQTIIKGMGELHLEILVDRMKREFKVEANVGAPQVAYREYLAKKVDIDYTHKKQSGGSGQFGRVKVEFVSRASAVRASVLRRDQGRQRFRRNISRRSRRASVKPPRPARSSASRSSTSKVHLSTAPTTTSTRRRWRSKSRSRRDARSCAEGGHQAARTDHEGRGRDPGRYLGDVIGDMNSRRGQIQGTDSRGNAQDVEAMVPLANMFGYVNQLRSFTQGRASYSMQFSHYDEVPQNVADEVKAKMA